MRDRSVNSACRGAQQAPHRRVHLFSAIPLSFRHSTSERPNVDKVRFRVRVFVKLWNCQRDSGTDLIEFDILTL